MNAAAGSELASNHPEVCVASIEAASQIARPLVAELADPNSVLYEVASSRIAGLPAPERLGIAPLLHVDPAKSGVVLARWQLQSGELPQDVDNDTSPESMVALWSASSANIPKLTVPEGADDKVMDLGDRLQMRGGGPVVFAREEVAEMTHLPNTLLQVTGAANNANRERIMSAIAYIEAVGAKDQPIVATVNPKRILRPKECETVAPFAPEATNELELLVDSAIEQGFVAPADNRYGVRFLPDGSSYLKMRHENGVELIVLAPTQELKADGSKQTGVFNAYNSLTKNPEIIGEDFKLAGSNIIQVTSTHYGLMAAMNNLNAVDELRTTIGSFRVIGDNQPARKAQAHLIEMGMTTTALQDALNNPRIGASLEKTL